MYEFKLYPVGTTGYQLVTKYSPWSLTKEQNVFRKQAVKP